MSKVKSMVRMVNLRVFTRTELYSEANWDQNVHNFRKLFLHFL